MDGECRDSPGKRSARMELRRRKGTLGGTKALCRRMLNAPRTRPKLGGPFPGRLDNRPGPAEGARGPRRPARLADGSQDSDSCWTLWVFPGGKSVTLPPPPLPSSPTLVQERMKFFVSKGSRPETDEPLVPRGRKIHVCCRGSCCHNLPGMKYCQLPTTVLS